MGARTNDSMLARNTRLRKEFLYRKSLEGKERAAYEHKIKVKEAIAEGKALPTELKDEEVQLRKQLEYDDTATEGQKTHIDDEYARAGIDDPKILITTSRSPSSRLIQFVKELKLVFPNAQRMNRGNAVVKDLVDACNANDITDLVVVHEHRGVPDGIVVCHLPYGPTAHFSLMNPVLRHDLKDSNLGTVSEVYPHLIFHNFKTPLGQRVANILKYLFPVPKEDSKRVMTFANENDYICFRHHVYTQNGKDVDLREVGPRFEMKLFQIKLGTLDQSQAETEWALRPYMNTAKKQKSF